MKITREAEYAVRCVLYLSGVKGRVVSRKEVSQAMMIPSQFLGKIVQRLSKAGLLEITQGAKGGYRLLKEPRKITLLEVVEAIMGEIFLNECIMRPEGCFRSVGCAVYKVWGKARDQLRETLAQATMADLLDQDICFPFHDGE